ncbi:unnamed protein product [Bursaphelenchus okinawaensis]|uniref:Uncharacterized protein n=1 Tax=Bursaphelenchus okinawaensis TaxID=465554 RepID=A0A811K3N4_9BILA|nr:unnamed protein product [Bursaphelenchus okinawaensis]CAG9091069.1 unnamed protein product [Bursaphelenchus okinawaensis]
MGSGKAKRATASADDRCAELEAENARLRQQLEEMREERDIALRQKAVAEGMAEWLEGEAIKAQEEVVQLRQLVPQAPALPTAPPPPPQPSPAPAVQTPPRRGPVPPPRSADAPVFRRPHSTPGQVGSDDTRRTPPQPTPPAQSGRAPRVRRPPMWRELRALGTPVLLAPRSRVIRRPLRLKVDFSPKVYGSTG